jgi:polyhydroxyalkanoate synthesis regulator protein
MTIAAPIIKMGEERRMYNVARWDFITSDYVAQVVRDTVKYDFAENTDGEPKTRHLYS